jgi:peroxiredoxin
MTTRTLATPTAWTGLVVALAVVAAGPLGAAKVGDPAPAFSVQDSNGKTHTLESLKGKWVVLEWHNQGCPYVGKHYSSGNMQRLQKEWTAKGVVWLTVESSAPGQQGHVTASAANEYTAKQSAAPTAVLLDASGKMGTAYGAKTTPHMFVISPEGKVVYNGAIDDDKSVANPSAAKNYISAALTEAMAGKAVTTTTSAPYGCGVKYATGTN